jgi:hypothetical protein
MMRNLFLLAQFLLFIFFCSAVSVSGQRDADLFLGNLSFNDTIDHVELNGRPVDSLRGTGFGPDGWVINRDKRGRDNYPPTPSQRIVRDGQAVSPDSGYLHISSLAIAQEAELLSAQFVHSRSSERLYVLPIDLCTKDLEAITFSMIWVCNPSLSGEDPDTSKAYMANCCIVWRAAPGYPLKPNLAAAQSGATLALPILTGSIKYLSALPSAGATMAHSARPAFPLASMTSI